MDFQVVVLAGGTSKRLVPLVSSEFPKALLPVANRPVISYVIELLETNNLKDLIVVVEGEDAALRVGGWISSAYVDRLNVEVFAVPEEVGTAGALRAVAHHLTASDIMVVSGDLVSDVPPGAVAATHRRHGAVITALLCAAPVNGPSESGSSGAKDKAKKLVRHNIIGLDPTRQFLLLLATGAEVEKDTRVQKSILRSVGKMEIRSDLMDAHLYAFKRTVLQEVLVQHRSFHSLKQDVVPYLVRSQLRSEVLNGAASMEEGLDEKVAPQNDRAWILQNLTRSSTGFYELSTLDTNSANSSQIRTHKCCAYIASRSKYCARLNSIQAFSDINRDVIGESSHLSGCSLSGQNSSTHSSAVLGFKTTVGPHCMLGEGSQLGDKCSVKRSAIGRHCRIGSNVKIENSVVMNYVTIEDGCHVRGSIICSNAHLQQRVVLNYCQVGAGFIVSGRSVHKAECLTRAEKSSSQ